ncbi:MAG: 16S rRNA (adenine(1518)-N(6)/adenine(1519)-N(6))-dimethyltransferase RsmA [Sedimentisphaeraceae bacterium JB056]
MQTKQQIQQILASIGARPDKKLGQNFLIDINLINFLLDKACIKPKDTVFEIGCGTGTLTEGLAERAGRVIVVEYDKLLSAAVANMFSDIEHVTIINGDALDGKNSINRQAIELISESQKNLGGRVLLVANLPYNIAASAMMNLVTAPPIADEMYVTIQKEVAQRMASRNGDELYGILSVIMGATGNVKILKKLGQNVFWPAPKIDSAMVQYIRDEDKISKICDIDVFRQVVSLFLGHRRKTLRACTKLADQRLGDIEIWPQIFESSGIDSQLRAEKLPPEDFVKLANTIVALASSV